LIFDLPPVSILDAFKARLLPVPERNDSDHGVFNTSDCRPQDGQMRKSSDGWNFPFRCQASIAMFSVSRHKESRERESVSCGHFLILSRPPCSLEPIFHLRLIFQSLVDRCQRSSTTPMRHVEI
jgi:hypothetical protein